MRRNLLNGGWFTVNTEEEHNNLKACGRLDFKMWLVVNVQKGEWEGSGRYLLLKYQQRCIRNCCYDDDVNEVLSARQVKEEVKKQMKSLAEMLEQANKPI